MSKPTWIFVAGSYRSGSTTQYQIVRDIVEETKNGKGFGYHTETKLKEHDDDSHGKYVIVKAFIPLFDKDVLVPRDQKPSRAVEFYKQKRLKAVISIRNPLDVITSMKRRNEGRNEDGSQATWSFEETARVNLPKWMNDAMAWVNLGPEITYWSKYEDFTIDLIGETKYIADFLGIEITEDQKRDIGRRYSIQSMNKRAHELKEWNREHPPEEHKRDDPWLPQVPGIVFGTSGNYKTWLSGPEQRMVRESCREFMERFGYE